MFFIFRDPFFCLILVDELVFFFNMFLCFAVAFLKYSENLHLIRGGKKKRVPENKKHESETVYCTGVFSGAAVAPPALHLRDNTRSTRQDRRADPHLQLYSCRIAS